MEDKNVARRSELASVATCILAGLAISCLPYLLWWPSQGEPLWFADNDEIGILTFASQAYHNHPWRIADGVGENPGTHPWMQFGPGLLATKGLGLGPIRIGLVWRIFAGLSIALGWYVLLRFHIPQPWLCATLAVMLMTDCGLLSGWFLLRNFVILGKLALGTAGPLFQFFPQIHFQWRISSPGLSLVYLLAYIWLLGRARAQPTPGRIVLAAMGLGVLFTVNFFSWTAAGLGLFLAILLDPAHRQTYLRVGVLGTALGLPYVLSGYSSVSGNPEAFHRQDKFLPIPRFSELAFPKMGFLWLAASFAWIWRKRKDLLYLWAIPAAALLLLNQQIFTGFTVENFHWMYVFGPILGLLVAIMAGSEAQPLVRTVGMGGANAPIRLILAFAGLFAALGFWLRGVEAMRTHESVVLIRTYGEYRSQRMASGTARLEPNSVLAGQPEFVNLAVIVENLRPLMHMAVGFSPSIGNRELWERASLNALLLGADRGDFEEEQRRDIAAGIWGPTARDPRKRPEEFARRMRSFDGVRADFEGFLHRYAVRYVALPSSLAPPDYLRSGWRTLESGPHWRIWERLAAAPKPRP